ncbi:MBL fold metallo-hydrolase [Thermoleophilia bacterium SCSIO 60948]|nr:MBL fold metallo-hydrolase [Thermoleophilia bacterium SCSIO 60948]
MSEPELDDAGRAALERAASLGIHRLRIPTPFAVGRVNCYLVEGLGGEDGLTLFDTGPNSGKALDELETQLNELGHAVEDLDLVVITHQHIDHLGLVDVVRRRADCEVAVIDVAVDYVENFGADAERDDEHSAALMLHYGIPEDIVTALRAVTGSFRSWGAATQIDRPLSDGGTLGRWDIALRPGHSPSDTTFWDPGERILIAGDHLIAHISSNPLLARPLDGSNRRVKSLLNYIDSMKRTRELPEGALVLPGHGNPITDHRSLIDERLAGHERRAAKIERLIRERSRTPYELAQAIWGNVAVTQAFLTLSEVIGHVDLLELDGRVREVVDERSGVLRFEAAGA